MNRAKIFIAVTFLLAFAVCVSAQVQTPKIVWKNIQEKYESFYDIKLTIVNLSDQPVYFDCSLTHFENTKMYSFVEQSDNTRLLYFDEERNRWDWNVMICGSVYKKDREKLRAKYKEIEKLQEKGKYIPAGCKINPNEEFILNFDANQWSTLIKGDGIGPTYKSGKFKFEINYWWYNSRKDSGQKTSESPGFLVIPKKETN